MAQSPPILIYEPGGGVSTPIGSNPPVYSQAGTTALVDGQAYIDVVFGSIQTDDEWVLVACEVVNTTDLEPLNIWPGIITDRSTAGFRLQLNGMPDSNSYYLSWAVSGINIEPSLATTYYLTGPSTGAIDEAITFTVSLPPSTYVNASVTVTPAEGGLEIGVFSPETVVLTTDSPSNTFTFTPALEGETTIVVNNDRGLTDPEGLVLTVAPPVATTYTLSGPSSGGVGVPSTNFTVALSPVGGTVTGTVTVTPSDGGGGGTFTPTSVGLTTAAPSVTFTYTPASGGAKTISVTNNGGLTNPGNLTYTASVLPLSDGDPVTTWYDSSVNGNNATQTGSARPTYKTNIKNGKPVVRFVSANAQSMSLATPFNGATNFTAIVVIQAAVIKIQSSICAAVGTASFGPFLINGDIYKSSTAGNTYHAASDASFHVFSSLADADTLYVDGTFTVPAFVGSAAAGNMIQLGRSDCDGDIAEVILYSGILSATDRANVEKYLGTKYAITVAGGSAVQPDTVTGLMGWWKADSL